MSLKLYHRDVLAGTIDDLDIQMFEMGGRVRLTPAGEDLRREIRKHEETDEYPDCYAYWSIVDEQGVRKDIVLQGFQGDDVIYWRQESA